MSLKKKLIILWIVSVFSIMIVGVVVSSIRIKSQGISSLEDKSRAILRRMEAARVYIGNYEVLDQRIKDIQMFKIKTNNRVN